MKPRFDWLLHYTFPWTTYDLAWIGKMMCPSMDNKDNHSMREYRYGIKRLLLETRLQLTGSSHLNILLVLSINPTK